MFPTDKEVAKLIKKMKKKVAEEALAKEKLKRATSAEPTVEDSSNEIFNEMKKLPFTS